MLFAGVTAIQIRDSENDAQLIAEEEEVKGKLKIEKLTEKRNNLMYSEKDIIEAYQKKLDKTIRNVEQGEMGRSLAMGKILDMKNSFQTLS